MDIARLQQEYRAKITEAKRLGDAFKGKEHEMPTETMDQISAILGQADEVKARLDLAQRMSESDAYLTEPAHAPAAATFGQGVPDLEVEPAYDSKSWRRIEHAGQTVTYHVPLAVQQKGYASAWESFMRKGSLDLLGPNDRKVLVEGTDTAGGFLVPEDVQSEVIKKLATMAVIRRLARVIQTGRDLVTFPRVNYATDDKYTSGVRFTWTGEIPASSTAHRATEPVFGQIAIPIHTAMASLAVSQNLLEDSMFNLPAYIGQLMGEAFALGEDDVFINGDGIGKPMGILAEVEGDGPAPVVSGDDGALTTSADAHSGKRLIDLYYTVPSQYRGQASWLMNSDTLNAVDNLVDSQKRPIVNALTNASLQNGEPGNIKGRPIFVDEFVPDLTTGSYSVIFGDISGYLIVDRVGMSVRRLTEINAQDNQDVFLARRRVGGYLIEPYKIKVLESSDS